MSDSISDDSQSKATMSCHPTKCDVTDDVKLFQTLYREYTVTDL